MLMEWKPPLVTITAGSGYKRSIGTAAVRHRAVQSVPSNSLPAACSLLPSAGAPLVIVCHPLTTERRTGGSML